MQVLKTETIRTTHVALTDDELEMLSQALLQYASNMYAAEDVALSSKAKEMQALFDMALQCPAS